MTKTRGTWSVYGRSLHGGAVKVIQTAEFPLAVKIMGLLNRSCKDENFHHFLMRPDTDPIEGATTAEVILPGVVFANVRTLIGTVTKIGVIEANPGRMVVFNGERYRTHTELATQFAMQAEGGWVTTRLIYPGMRTIQP